jgi:hypothetical protein
MENAGLQVVVGSQATELAELRARLGRSPRNSSMPPSAEGFLKPRSPSRASVSDEPRRDRLDRLAPSPDTLGGPALKPPRVVSHYHLAYSNAYRSLQRPVFNAQIPVYLRTHARLSR